MARHEDTYSYEKQELTGTYEGNDPLAEIAKKWSSCEAIINGNLKVVAQRGDNSVVKARELLRGSLETGSITLGDQKEYDADEIDKVEFYQVIREEA